MPRIFKSIWPATLLRLLSAAVIAIGTTGAARQMTHAASVIMGQTARESITALGSGQPSPHCGEDGFLTRLAIIPIRVKLVRSLWLWSILLLSGGWTLALREALMAILMLIWKLRTKRLTEANGGA